MKQYQISEQLFRDLVLFHLLDQNDDPELETRIRKALQDKVDRAAAREKYEKELKKNDGRTETSNSIS